MPQLKQLSCCVQWADTGAPFQEHGTVYGDGVVETFIIVPNKPQGFCLRLTSKGYIYEGIAMMVFVDGNYQVNRSRVNLLPPKKGLPTNRTEVDWLLRQKERPQGDGVYMGREWRFDNHNIVQEPPEGFKESHFDDLGTIEVLVLRCRATNQAEACYEGSSSAEDSDVFEERAGREDEEEAPTQPPGTTPTAPAIAAVAGPSPVAEEEATPFAGLFDGANDYHEAWNRDGGGNDRSQGRWVWHQKSSPIGLHSETPQRAPPGDRFRTQSFEGPYYYPSQATHPMQQYTAERPQKRVHFDYGSRDSLPQQGYDERLHRRSSHYSEGTPGRPVSRVRVRSNERRTSDKSRPPPGPPYSSQQVQMTGSQMRPPPQQMQQSQPQQQQDSVSYSQPQWGYGNGYAGDQQDTLPDSYERHNVPNSQDVPSRRQSHEQAQPPPEPLSRINQPTHRSSQYQRSSPAVQFPPVPHSRPEHCVPHLPHPQPVLPHLHYPRPMPSHGYQHYPYVYGPSSIHWPMHYHHYGYPLPRVPQVPPIQEEQVSPKNTTYLDPGVSSGDNAQCGDNSAWSTDNVATTNGNGWDDHAQQEGNGNSANTGAENAGAGDNATWDQTWGGANGDNNGGDGWTGGGAAANNNFGNNNDNAQGGDWNGGQNDNTGGGNEAWGAADAGNADVAEAGGGGWNDDSNGNAVENNADDNAAFEVFDVPRELYGPHGPYYSFRALRLDEPRPDAEEEPRFDVPKSVAVQRGSTKQVQPGPGYRYFKKRSKPEYIDSFENPYARFVFKYRTKDQLLDEIGIEVETEPSGDQEIQKLQGLDKETLVQMVLRATAANGGKIPSPPLAPSTSASGSDSGRPHIVDAPVYPYLKYALPPLRPMNANMVRNSSPAHSIPRQSAAGAAHENNNNFAAQNVGSGENWNGNNRNASNTWDNNNNNNQLGGGATGAAGASGWDGSANNSTAVNPQPSNINNTFAAAQSRQSFQAGQGSNQARHNVSASILPKPAPSDAIQQQGNGGGSSPTPAAPNPTDVQGEFARQAANASAANWDDAGAAPGGWPSNQAPDNSAPTW